MYNSTQDDENNARARDESSWMTTKDPGYVTLVLAFRTSEGGFEPPTHLSVADGWHSQ